MTAVQRRSPEARRRQGINAYIMKMSKFDLTDS